MIGELHLRRRAEDTVLVELAGNWKLGEALPSAGDVAQKLEGAPEIRNMAFDTRKLGDWDTGMLTFDARKGKWGFFGDTIAANLGKDTTVDGIKIDPTVKSALLTAGGFYELGTWKLSDTAGKDGPAVTIDGMFGVRYTYLDMKLDFKGIGDASGDQDWVDPLIGARAIFDLSEHWTLSFNGDVGGFGLGSDFAWDAVGLIGYRFGLFGKDNATAFGGYRARYQDYTDGSGDDKFEWDVTLHGPLLGLAIGF